MCSAFRTFQGWTALSDIWPGQGVLHAVPIPAAMGYVLLRALQDDVADDDLCGAVNGQSLPVTGRYHSVLLPALTPIPAVQPGDTVWWHADMIHSVGEVSGQKGWGNVMYIPAAPYCEKKNRDSPQTVETLVVVIMARAGWLWCARVRRGQAVACPFSLLPGAAVVSGVKGGPAGPSRAARCAAPWRPEGRPRTLSGRSKASGGEAASVVRPAQRARRGHAASFPARACS
jgi:hypothetical protein